MVLNYKTLGKKKHMRMGAATELTRTRLGGSLIVGGRREIDMHIEAAAVVTSILSLEA